MKRFICCLFLILLFSSSYSYAFTILHQEETSTKISSGATLKNYRIFADTGWLNINVIEVDITDKYTNIGLLSSSDGVGKLKNVLSMAQDSNAIAAINGDFFSGKAGKGHSIGLAIQDSEIVSSAALDNSSKETFSTFLLNNDNKVFFNYLTNKITLTSQKNNRSFDIQCINKYADNYSYPAIYTSKWGQYSIGSSDTLNLTELVVSNNKVTEIRYNQPPVEIPSNGFVVSVLSDNSDFITENFKINTKVKYELSFSPKIDEIEFAISGGAKLIDNGIIPTSFSHDITGKNPRTAIGTDESGKTIYLVTVDGRQSVSVGMTQRDFAEFLKNLQIYNAINLDGGGSTTMVAQELGKSSLSIINKPSSGILRSVSNAVGIFSTAPKSKKLFGLKILIDDTNMFKDEEHQIKVIGYNKYYSPIEIEFDEVKWSYDGVNLEIENGKILGRTAGSSTLTASIGKIKDEVEINILSEANELFISPKKITTSPGEIVNYTIEAKDRNGYYAKTDLTTIATQIVSYYLDGEEQKDIPKDAKIENLSFSAETPGEYVISFSKGTVTSYAVVSVNTQKAVTLDDFETESFKFDEYPDEVKGNATLSNEKVISGKSSVKLEYDFNQDIQIRGAYIELNKPLIIPSDATSLGLWVYNDSYKDEMLKVKIKDASGNTKLIVLEDNLSHNGWKEINYPLNGISLPATISDIYLAQDNLLIKNAGYIYVDNLFYYTNSNDNSSHAEIPKDKKIYDENNIKITGAEEFKIALLDDIVEPNLMIEKLKNITLTNSINQNADLTIVTQRQEQSTLSDIKTDIIVAKDYDLKTIRNVSFITLDISNNGIRNTDATEWQKLDYDIRNSKTNNIFIILNNSIDTFDDIEERKLFIDTLYKLKKETNTTITVLHTGFYTDYSMENSIKFLGINTKNIKPEEIASKSSYILISIVGNNISYEIKKLF